MSSAAVLRIGVLAIAWLIICGLALLRFDADGVFSHSVASDSGLAGGTDYSPLESIGNSRASPDAPASWASEWVAHVSEVEVEFDLLAEAEAVTAPWDDPVRTRENRISEVATLPLEFAVEDIAKRVVETTRRGPLDSITQHDLQIVVDRVNAASTAILMHVSDPSVEAARRLAVRTQALFVEAGLDLSLMDVVAASGPSEVHIYLTPVAHR